MKILKGVIGIAWDAGRTLLIAALIVVPIRMFVFQPFLVRGASMEPSFHDGDYLVVDELTYRIKSPERGQVIVFKYPGDTTQRYIKRIVGLPGETVEVKDGIVTIKSPDGIETQLDETYLPEGLETKGTENVELGKGQYFVMGDNRTFSSDSRAWGPLGQEYVIGKVLFRAFPLSEAGGK